MDWKSAIAAGVGGLITAFGIYLFGLIPSPRTLVIPKGTVIATTAKSCPGGWKEYNAPGRVIVGADGTDFPPGDIGGDPTQSLTVANLPPHSHQQKLSGGVGSLPGYTHVANQNWGFTNHGDDVDHKTGLGEGQAVPFSIMQPYVALVFCEKE